jgi:hypothetical protein
VIDGRAGRADINAAPLRTPSRIRMFRNQKETTGAASCDKRNRRRPGLDWRPYVQLNARFWGMRELTGATTVANSLYSRFSKCVVLRSVERRTAVIDWYGSVQRTFWRSSVMNEERHHAHRKAVGARGCVSLRYAGAICYRVSHLGQAALSRIWMFFVRRRMSARFRSSQRRVSESPILRIL